MPTDENAIPPSSEIPPTEKTAAAETEAQTDTPRDARDETAVAAAWLRAMRWQQITRDGLKRETALPLEAIALAVYLADSLRAGSGDASSMPAALADRWVDAAIGPSQEVWHELVSQAQRSSDRYRSHVASVRRRAIELHQRLVDAAARAAVSNPDVADALAPIADELHALARDPDVE